ncbi:LuxR C-terminal-related transcriptional regulator [Phyllobacterium sp.]|uniref:LuxR C-terminal-related transcriptional regulator n=1 Tax=Phyllobacterium sp. TaxID=1871046 RepID=UPI0030F435FD
MRQKRSSVASVARVLERGRESYKRHAWADAYKSLSFADDIAPLGVEDLELLAMSAYLIARDDDYLRVLSRAYQAHLDAGDSSRAARCAFWLGLRLLFRDETGRATGWFARARRLLECQEQPCVEDGYLLLPAVEQELNAGNCAAAYAIAADAAKIGDRFGEPDLIAIARHLQGRALIQQGHVEEGLALLDEAMLTVTAGDLSPLVTGLIYCSVIDGCHQVYAVGRAREWTLALAEWCAAQPEMVSFSGKCLVHRAEIMQFNGAWSDAIAEARRGCERFEQGIDPQRPAFAYYQLAEVHRLQGEFALAEEAYRNASRWGCEPQPGLALLRMAQGRVEIAVRAIRRVVSATTTPLELARLLPAYVEIMLDAGEIEDARAACQELQEIAERFHTGVIGALAAHALGAVQLADGDPQAALGSLRRALQVWQQVEAPHMVARARLLVGLACRALADEEGAGLELDAARAVFEQLGAMPDLGRLQSLTKGAPSGHRQGLTPRELQVLRLIATGKTNKGIATELFLSGRTVDRHVSNIFTKLNLPSRAAATAYAYEYKLI